MRLRAAFLGLMLFTAPAGAQPLLHLLPAPPARPEQAVSPSHVGAGFAAVDGDAAGRSGRLSPAFHSKARALAPPPRRPAAPAPRPQPGANAASPDPGSAAGGGLCADPRIRGARLPRIVGRGRCGIRNPIRLTHVAGVAVSPPVSVDCAAARALADWVENGVKPALAAQGEGAARLHSMAGYACRTRNSRIGARLSEHAFGRAVDIGGFTLTNGRRITLLQGWNGADGRFLRQVWRAACGPFKTVLGPESNVYHRDHFHFDVARRRSTYCR